MGEKNMLNLEKEIKKDEVKLLSRYELKWEDKIKLDKIPVYVSCTRVYGVDRTMCRITIPCVNNHNKNFEKIHTSKFSTLSKTKYEIFLDEWNHKATESVVMNLPIRLIKGKNKNDRMYYMYELFLSPSVTLYITISQHTPFPISTYFTLFTININGASTKHLTWQMLHLSSYFLRDITRFFPKYIQQSLPSSYQSR